MAKILIENGYDLATINDYTIKTEPRKLKSWDFEITASKYKEGYKMSIYLISNVSLYVGGGVSTGPSRTKMKNKGMEINGNKVAFNHLHNIAEQFGCELLYE